MRPSSRQRVAAWLLAATAGRGGEGCTRRGRLEMISFWLLCWKLLRATAGLRRNTPELTDGNQDDSVPSNSIPINSSLTPTHVAEPVTMETSSSPLLPEKKTDQLTSSCGQEAKEHHYPEGRGLREEDKNEKGEEEDDDHRDQEETKERELDEGCLILELKEREGGGGDRKQVSMEHGQGERDDLSDGHLSDGHLGDGHLSDGHLSDGHLSDCLQAELAIVTSDSDAGDDQWVSSASHEVTVRYVKGKGTQDGVCSTEREEGEGEEEERGEEQEEERKDEEKEGQTEAETQREESDEDLIEARDHLEDQRKPMRDVLPRSPSVSSSSSSTDTDRKLPADFCVLQEWSSENVFTEHLDFLLARQQWRKMEDEDKGKPLPQPSGRSQRSVQGTHSALYPPTRSPRLQHSSEDSGLDESSYRSPLEETESAVEREIRLTLEREERHRRERGVIAQGLTIPRPASLKPGRSPPRPPACRTPTLSISPSPSPSLSSSSLPRSAYHEMTANNVIILEPDSSHSASRTRLLTPGGFSDWSLGPDAIPSTDVIVVETSNLIIRSASEFCLSSIPVVTETQESTFSSNPFFKLRSISSQSLVDQEIRMVRQREEEWRRQREEEWRRRRERERYDTVLVSPGLSDNISYNVSAVPDRSVSSPSSPSRTRKMERSSMSCDHKRFR